MENFSNNTASPVQKSQDLFTKIKQQASSHPALSRMREKVMQQSDAQSITDYSRMHHRHNRS
ncbi:YhhA family cyclophane-containing RiPP [Pedobacter sp. KBW06]|uniref:YhhA family cyclophane-containing RiPP n=1 Tax=Pedobacter sp. KBW06 TaxID=2153359 RepID=UPI000F59BFAA|nr:YhhA family cyclophane-containing RiPP [Pedobacter sp. KBW06]